MSARSALKELFELLEEYAPMWYTEEHRRLAVAALGKSAEDATRADRAGASSRGPTRKSASLNDDNIVI
jgi:hypothetical protein